MLHFLDQFNAVIGVLLFSAYLYQVFYTLYGLVVCPRDRRKAKRPNSTPIPPSHPRCTPISRGRRFRTPAGQRQHPPRRAPSRRHQGHRVYSEGDIVEGAERGGRGAPGGRAAADSHPSEPSARR